jgi:hypothetical protein
MARALELARSFTACAGSAQAGLKRLIDAGYGLSGAAARELELEAWCASYATDARARLREFFARGARTRARSQNRSPRRRSRHCSAKASAFKW